MNHERSNVLRLANILSSAILKRNYMHSTCIPSMQAIWAASCRTSKLAQQTMQLCNGSSKTLRVKTSHEGIFLHPALALLHDGMPQKSEMRPGDLFKAGPRVSQLINHGVSATSMIKVLLVEAAGLKSM